MNLNLLQQEVGSMMMSDKRSVSERRMRVADRARLVVAAVGGS